MTEQILTNSLFPTSKMYNRLYSNVPMDPASLAAQMKMIQTTQVERKLQRDYMTLYRGEI